MRAEDEEVICQLLDHFWPGPLTLVLARQKIVPDLVIAGLETVAVRMSAHPVFTQVISLFGQPIAAPSANRFGRISPTTALHVLAELEGRIPLIIDGGSTTHGLESTIIAVRSGRIEILREGPITAEQLGEFGEVCLGTSPEQPEAPGQLRSHYAPRTPLELTTSLATSGSAARRVGALTFGPTEMEDFAEIRTLSASRDLREAAANLFRYLRELDDAQLDLIVAEEIPEVGLGAAIMDRLRRAAAR
jgi:L-threonylcarbamoyladenylate synthase